MVYPHHAGMGAGVKSSLDSLGINNPVGGKRVDSYWGVVCSPIEDLGYYANTVI